MKTKLNKYKNISLFDFKSTSYEHLIFNESIINFCSEISSNVTLFASKDHINSLDKIPQNVIKNEWSKIYSNRFLLNIIYREIYGFFRFIKNLKVFHSSNKNIILCSSLSVFLALWFILALNFFLKKKISLDIILHSEIEDFFTKKTFASNLKIFSIKNIKRHINFYIVGEHALQNTLNSNKDLFHLKSINHPFYIEIDKNNEKEKIRKNKKFVVSGVVKKNKNEPLNVISDIKKIFGDKDIEIVFIGRFLEGVKPYKSDNVSYPFWDYKNPISQQKYDEYIKNADFIFLNYDYKAYTYKSSGAIFDVIKFNKNIFVKRNNYFEFLEKRNLFPGFILKSLKEDKSVLDKDYELQKRNFIEYSHPNKSLANLFFELR